MIQKTTKIICDNCDEGIYDIIGNLPETILFLQNRKAGLLSTLMVAVEQHFII